MKKLLLLIVFLIGCNAHAQVYTMQNGTISTCSGTFYDSGGAAGNYSASENYQITFCPATPGTYIQLNFTDFDLEGEPFDYMNIYNGTGTGGTLIGSFGITSPMCATVIASTHPSGCITVTFVSDGSLQYGGWAAQVVCSNVPGGVPVGGGPSNAVCSGADPFCADSGPLEFPNSSDGGCVPDAPAVITANTCLITAPNPAWYYLEIGVPGNVNLEIEQTTGPNGTGTGLDVDYAIWGPFANAADTCADFTLGGCLGDHSCYGNVVDCSFSDQPIENATIPNAQVGQIYMVLITNFDGAPGFIRMTQTNSGSPGAGSTDCSIVCPTAAGTNPTTCGATNGSIRISGLDPNTNYTVTYLDDGLPVSVAVTSNASGQATISGLNAGNYTNIGTNFPGCSSVLSNIVLTAATAPVLTGVTSNTPICSGSNAVFNLSGTANATVTYTINSGGNQTVVLSGAGTATVTVNSVSTTTTMNITSISLPGCTATLAVTSIVSLSAAANITLNSAPATTNQTLCVNSAIANIVYTIGGGATGASATGLPTGVTGSFSAGSFTISGTPTVSGPFNYTVTTSGGCSVASLSGTITVDAAATIALNSAPATANQTLCVNSAITNISYTIGGGATGASATGLPTGVAGSFSAGTFTISGTPTVSGPFNYTVTTSGGCSVASLSGTITVDAAATIALNSAPATTNQTLCVNSAIANISYTIGGGGTGASVTGLPTGVTGSFSAGTFTISGTPNVSGPFNYTVTTSGGCSVASLSGTITVDAAATIALNSAPATANQTLCVNSAIANISYTIGGGATGASATGLPTGVTGTFSAGTFTISGTPNVSGPFNYTVTTSGGCSIASLSGTITVDAAATIALNSAPATTNQTLCVNSAIASIGYTIGGGATGASVTGLPTGVTGSFSAGTFTISGTPTVSGPFNYTVTTSGGCSIASLSGTITVNPDATLTLSSAATTTSQTVCINTAIINIGYTVGNATGANVTGLPTGVTGNFAAGIFTISGTPTTTGTFNYTVTTSGGCAADTATGMITIGTDMSIGLTSVATTDSQTVCINTAITNIVYTPGNGTINVTATGLPTGVTGNFIAGVFTISGTPTVSGTFNYSVTAVGNCTPASLAGSITVNPDAAIALNSAPATASQTLCINTAIANIGYAIGGSATGAGVIGLPIGVTGSFSAGIFTISGMPTESGLFNYTVTTSGGCSVAVLSGTITVNPDATIVLDSVAATANQTLCVNTAIANIDYMVGGGATGASVTGLPTGVTGSFSAGMFTISGTPTATGIFNYTVTTSGGCASAALPGTITVTGNVTMAIAGSPNQTVCTNTPLLPLAYTIGGGATGANVSGLPAGVTGSFASGVFTISGTPINPGVFNYTVTTTGGCSSVVLGGVITVNQGVQLVLDPLSFGNQTVCINSSIADIHYNALNNPANITVTGLPAGVTGSFIGGVFTITGAPTASGVYNYTVTTVGGCGSDTVSGTITVSPMATIAQISASGTESQTICIATPLTSIVYEADNGATGATASGLPTGITGTFSGGQFIISGTPIIPGNFNYTVMTTGGCGSATLSGTITVTPSATLTLSSGNDNQTLCIATPMTNVVYAVANGATGATVLGLPTGISASVTGGMVTISGTPAASGIFHYTVTATGNACASPSLTGTITVSPNATMVLASAVATGNQTLCVNNPIANISYAVANAIGATVSGLPAGVTGIFNSGVMTISGTPTVSGVFNFTVATSGGCSGVALNGSISVNPDTTIVLASGNAHQVVCINTPIVPVVYTITAGSGATVANLPPGVTAVYNSGTLTISGTPTTSGEFDFSIATNGLCLQASTLGSITVNPNAVIALNSAVALTSQIICINSAIQPISYTVSSGANGATVTGLPTGLAGNYAAGVFSISGTATQSGVFNYNVTTTGGCATDSETGTITVNALATATMQYTASPYCTTLTNAQPITISGTGPFTGGVFSSAAGLSLNPVNGAINPSLSTPGNYTVTYVIPASGGCPAIPVYATLAITKVPTAAISYATPFCTAVNALQVVSLSGTEAYLGGTFSAPAGLSLNPMNGAINPSLSAPGNYTVTYLTPAAGGCPAIPATANVTINATPVAVATPALQAICSEDATNISLGSLVAGTSFTWTVVQNNVNGASNGSGNLIAQTLATTGNAIGTAVYTIVPSTAFCTGNPIVVTVTVNPLPRPSLVGGVICRNPNTGIVMRTYTLNAGLNNADYDFVWSHNTGTISGANDNTYVADEPGIYTVVATNIHTGCVSYPVDAAVSESEIAEIAVISGNDAFVDDPVITVTVIGSGNYEYQLDNGNFQASNVFANVNIGEHTIRVRDQDDCTDIEQQFTVIGYPKFFTPNNDGFNDTWNIFALSGQKEAKISIFDRYGKLIKQISTTTLGWDGTYNGHPLPSTDYWFVVEYLDQSVRKEFKAHFSLKR